MLLVNIGAKPSLDSIASSELSSCSRANNFRGPVGFSKGSANQASDPRPLLREEAGRHTTPSPTESARGPAPPTRQE